MAYVVCEPMKVMELVSFWIVILSYDLGLTRPLGSLRFAFDARM